MLNISRALKINIIAISALFMAGCSTMNHNKKNLTQAESKQSQSQPMSYGLGQSTVLNSKNLSSNIDGYNNYSSTQQHAIKKALYNMPCQIVLFNFNSYKLTASSKLCLNSAAKYLIKYNQPISLAGNTDPRGSENYNINLGQKRALVAMNYLISRNVPAPQLCAISYGESRPSVNLSSLYSKCNNADNLIQCRMDAQKKAYRTDRRVDLEFGLKCN